MQQFLLRAGLIALTLLALPADGFAQISIPRPNFPPPNIGNPLDEAARLDRARLEAQKRAEAAARQKAAELAAARRRAEEEARKLAERKAALERQARQVRDQFERLKRTAEQNRRDVERMHATLSGGPGRARDQAVEQVRRAGVLGTNKAEVQRSLQGRGLAQVLYAKEFDHYEQQQFAGALGASVASGNPGPALVYLKGFLAQSKAEVLRNLRSARAEVRDKLAREFEMLVIRALDQAVRQGRVLQVSFDGLDVEIGLATYNHWAVVRWDEPSLEQVSSGIPGVPGLRIRQTPRERRLPLPNTFQPYLKVRLRTTVR